MINWKDRVSEDVKAKIDLDKVVEAFKSKIAENRREGLPLNFSNTKATKDMMNLLEEKGVSKSSAVHLLHVCEVLPYSGCGCCEHRKAIRS